MKNLLQTITLFAAFCLAFGVTSAQKDFTNNATMRIAWWNVENYFNPQDDSVKFDEAFTPDGSNHFTYKRFYLKRDNIYKTIVALGQGELPAIMGFCEVEDEWVMRQLCFNTPLSKFHYHYVHYESPDRRGIDNALIYRPDRFTVLYSKPISVAKADDSTFFTRDILLVSGVTFQGDTLFIFVNHFPSKLGGDVAEVRRNYVASVLKRSIDTVMERHPKSGVIIMGDFNDSPFADCIVKHLGIGPEKSDWERNTLINLVADKPAGTGSYKYQADWSCIDQMMASKNLVLESDFPLIIKDQTAVIFDADFLLVDDPKFMGKKIFRTYIGGRYQGGFSDHLPLYIDLIRK